MYACLMVYLLHGIVVDIQLHPKYLCVNPFFHMIDYSKLLFIITNYVYQFEK